MWSGWHALWGGLVAAAARLLSAQVTTRAADHHIHLFHAHNAMHSFELRAYEV